MTRRNHLPWLLGTLVLCAQLVLAWHEPSHIDTDFSHAQSVQECQLGSQAHAPGLPTSCPDLALHPEIKPILATASVDAASLHFFSVLARGPPTC